MKKDNWQLETLFHFDEEMWKLKNDMGSDVIVKSRDGQDVSLSAGHTLDSKPDQYSIVLPNNRTYRQSDKSVLTEAEFSDNFNTITGHLIRRLREGQIIAGLDFLDYHYAWTKKKKTFLTFLAHYILSSSWTSAATGEKEQDFRRCGQ